jgi:DNA-binding NtrC family response regulator
MMETLYEHDWPGNIRELQNVIHRWLTVGRLDFFSSVPSRNKGLGTEAAAGGGGDYHLKRSVEAYERRLIVSCLRETGWRRGAAASILGVDRKTLFRKMRKYGVEVPRMWGENDTC